MNFSFLVPSRNGVEFLEWSYNSIRKNQGNHTVEILVLDDISDKDNTWEWCLNTMNIDPMFKAFTNTSGERFGISGGHKYLSERATMDIICHWHNDMYLTSGALDMVEKYLTDMTCICLTRIEHSMGYQGGPEKIVWNNAPLEFNEWDEDKFLNALPELSKAWNDKKTGGHFAPYFIYRNVYNEIGSNDVLMFFKQAREDSDFGFRIKLYGMETLQIPSFVFHFASRGNRRNKYETDTLTDNPAWKIHDMKATRNFIRKWQTFTLHDDLLMPTPPSRYETTFILYNSDIKMVEILEPWCDSMYTELSIHDINEYISHEQSNTIIDLHKKFINIPDIQHSSIVVTINGRQFTNDDFYLIQNISKLVDDTASVGEYTVGNLLITINNLDTHQHELIKLNEPYYTNKFLNTI